MNSEPTFERCLEDNLKPYFIVFREMAQDKSISPKAKGVLVYLLSLSDNWKIHHSHVRHELCIGEDYLNSAIEELLAAGYAERSREKLNGAYQPYKYKIRALKKIVPNGKTPPGDLKEFLPDGVSRPGIPGPGNPVLDNTYRESTYIKKQQQQSNLDVVQPKINPSETAAASFEKKTFPEKQPNRTVMIYDFLKNVDIPEIDKKEISSRYDRDTVQNAIAWSTHPQTKLTKGLVQAIKWACQNKPNVPKNEKDEISENKAYAKRFDGVKIGSATVSVLNQCIEIEYGTPYKPTTAISYEEKGFREQLDSALRKIGYSK